MHHKRSEIVSCWNQMLQCSAQILYAHANMNLFAVNKNTTKLAVRLVELQPETRINLL